MLTWIAENWDVIFELLGIVIVAASMFVKMFSKYKWAEKISKVLDWISVVNTEENKAKIEAVIEKKKKQGK